MRDRIAYTALYAQLYARKAQQAAISAKDSAVENRNEIARLAGTAVVVGVAARVNGFKAGYEFAKNSTPVA
jgi:hypothetical protein